MKVRTTCTLKNKAAGGIIPKGTIFEGTEETLPKFVLDGIEKKKAFFEILPEVKKKTAGRPKKVEVPVEETLSKPKAPKPPVKPKKKSNEKSATLREKLKNVG